MARNARLREGGLTKLDRAARTLGLLTEHSLNRVDRMEFMLL